MLRMFFIVVVLFCVVFNAGAKASVSDRSIDDMVKQLEEAKKSVGQVLEDTASQLGINNVNDYELCAMFREKIYEIMRERGVVTEDGWITFPSETEDGTVYMKMDEFCNVYKRVVQLDTSSSPDVGDIERQKEVPPPPSSPTVMENYAFVGFLLTSLTAIFLLYGTVRAFLSKQLLTAFGRGMLFFILTAISYIFFKSIGT